MNLEELTLPRFALVVKWPMDSSKVVILAGSRITPWILSVARWVRVIVLFGASGYLASKVFLLLLREVVVPRARTTIGLGDDLAAWTMSYATSC